MRALDTVPCWYLCWYWIGIFQNSVEITLYCISGTVLLSASYRKRDDYPFIGTGHRVPCFFYDTWGGRFRHRTKGSYTRKRENPPSAAADKINQVGNTIPESDPEDTVRVRIWRVLAASPGKELTLKELGTKVGERRTGELRNHLQHVKKQSETLQDKKSEWKERRGLPTSDTKRTNKLSVPNTTWTKKWSLHQTRLTKHELDLLKRYTEEAGSIGRTKEKALSRRQELLGIENMYYIITNLS